MRLKSKDKSRKLKSVTCNGWRHKVKTGDDHARNMRIEKLAREAFDQLWQEAREDREAEARTLEKSLHIGLVCGFTLVIAVTVGAIVVNA